MTTRRTRRAARRMMWVAIGGAVMLLGVLLRLGWDERAWSAAAGVLLVSCVFVCIWAVVQGRATDREVRLAVARLVAAREAQRRGVPDRDTLDGR